MNRAHTSLVLMLGLTWALSPVQPASASDEVIEWEPVMVLGKDVFPSLLISTATVDWTGAQEHDEPEATESETPATESSEEETAAGEPADGETSDGETADGEAADGEAAEASSEAAETEVVYGDPNSWFGVTISGLSKDDSVTVEIAGDGWVKPSRLDIQIEDEMEVAVIKPKLIFDFDLLHQVRQQKPVNLTFKVSVNGDSQGERTETLIMHEINDCPFFVDNGEGEAPLDLKWMFAAYVNENHPWIDSLLKEALQTGLVQDFTGYQREDEKIVISQVFAVWHVLQRRGIKYSDITTTPRGNRIYSQTVRFMEDSIDATQANCVDGSVLLASVLRKIGLNVSLALVPGHCFLAVDLEREGKKKLGIETTMLGQNNLSPIKELPNLADEVKQQEFAESFATFDAATTVGTNNLETNAEKFQATSEIAYQLIPIALARRIGIMPLASAKGKQ